MKVILFIKKIVLIVLLSTQAYSEMLFDRQGTLDQFSKGSLILNDVVMEVSKLVNCYDTKGKKLIACTGLKVGDKVGVFFDLTAHGEPVVIEIHQLSK